MKYALLALSMNCFDFTWNNYINIKHLGLFGCRMETKLLGDARRNKSGNVGLAAAAWRSYVGLNFGIFRSREKRYSKKSSALYARYETVSTQRELDISKNASKFLEKVENRFIGIFHLFVFTTFAILQKLPLGVAPLAHTQYIL